MIKQSRQIFALICLSKKMSNEDAMQSFVYDLIDAAFISHKKIVKNDFFKKV